MNTTSKIRMMIPVAQVGNLNRQLFYMTRSTMAKANRGLAKAAAVHQSARRMPEGQLVHLDVEIGFPDRRARDLDNLVIKPFIDGFVDARIITDDKYQVVASITRRRSLRKTTKGMIRFDFTFTTRDKDVLPDGYMDGVESEEAFAPEDDCFYDDSFIDPYDGLREVEGGPKIFPEGWETQNEFQPVHEDPRPAPEPPTLTEWDDTDEVVANFTPKVEVWSIPKGTDYQVGDAMIDVIKVAASISGYRVYELDPGDFADWGKRDEGEFSLVDADPYTMQQLEKSVSRVLGLPDWARSKLNLKSFEQELLFADPSVSMAAFVHAVLPVLGAHKATGKEQGVFVKRSTANLVGPIIRDILTTEHEAEAGVAEPVEDDEVPLSKSLMGSWDAF